MALATALSLTACSSSEVAVQEIKAAAAISIEDGGTSSATRVIALANGSAEILVSLGLKPILIGRDIASTEEVLLDIPIVTSGHQVVAENILKLNPDLVLIDDATGPLAAIKTLRENGIKIVQVRQAWTLSDINLKIADIAGAVGAIPSGVALSEKINQSLSEVKKADRKARIAFLYLRGGNSIYLLGGKGSGADSLITAINSVDAGAEFSKDPFTPVSAEVLAELNPDVILVMSKGLASVGGVAGLKALPGVAQTSAGKKGRILAVDDSLLLSFGPRTPDLILQMAASVDELMK
ncbi:iron complex transport system substrate-binding protein [Candidatus Planktophila lacus]|uniref:heme/hemin ABC transporter substrate-binding protein n=1 Tax=Candidatus Planktophila lacus TaxID=1884913 RepID=UPI000BC0EF37|nr:ABC transporter substrate-binding protein [Candidatus Planktophila lacus]ASY28855.1 iron complex transport system substrate-binding protein [Candidatus Planktophila lacus]